MIEKHLALSQQLDLTDLDWEVARRAGLTPQEREVLTYFADIESQTVFYLIEVLKLRAAQDHDTLAFATIWNYEEYFHGRAIARLLAECGYPLSEQRSIEVRSTVQLRAKLEDVAQRFLARLFPRSFVTLWMAWGASQEALTLRGYERLAATTANPVLRTLCDRIAKQERRHFAWYYQTAREHLSQSRFDQRFVRFIFERFWTPVGAGVKSDDQVARLMTGLFSKGDLELAAAEVDQRMGKLPGMAGFDVVGRWAQQLFRRLPAFGALPASPTPPDRAVAERAAA